MDVPRTAAISAGPLAATFYARSSFFPLGVSNVSERGRERGREGDRVTKGFCEEPCVFGLCSRAGAGADERDEREREREGDRGCGCGGNQNRTPLSHELN